VTRRHRIRGSIAVASAVLCMATRPAHANVHREPSPAVSTRPDLDIVGHRVRGPDGRELPAVRIEVGERIHLALRWQDGRVISLAVLPEVRSEEADITLLYGQRRSMLVMINHGEVPLRASVASTAASGDEAIERGPVVTRAGGAAARALSSAPPALLVYGFEQLAPIAPTIAGEGGYLGVTVTGGIMHNDLGELNRELRANGYTEVGDLQPIYGFAFDGAIGRWRGGLSIEPFGSRTFQHATDGSGHALGQVAIQIDAGYILVRAAGLRLFPSVGLTAGDLHLDVDYDAPAILPEQLGGLEGRGETIRSNRYTSVFSLGADYLLSIGGAATGILLTLRGGYIQQLGQHDWVRQDADALDLRGGPAVDVSGPFVRLGVGIYVGK